MGRARIAVRGVRVEGRHGANRGEQERAQPFVVDLDVEVDVASDTLDATADYRALVGAAVEAVESTSVVLLETLAETVARAVRGMPGVLSVSATVHKPDAAGSLEIEDVAATAILE